ncbi:MAG TPA: hypothetical protein VMD30_05500 [Tepidisphaeraceae bacterium]|nr:hypothetical protein [Tepidisphaeraceae bacterium]
MSTIAGQAALLDATMQLGIVQSIRQAIQAADNQAGQAASSQIVSTPSSSLPVSQPAISEPVASTPRAPVVQTQQIVHRDIELRYVAGNHEPCHCQQPAQPSGHHDHPSVGFTIQPPWTVLPWQNPAPVNRTVKITVVRPDILSKGTMIDSFI